MFHIPAHKNIVAPAAQLLDRLELESHERVAARIAQQNAQLGHVIENSPHVVSYNASRDQRVSLSFRTLSLAVGWARSTGLDRNPTLRVQPDVESLRP